MTRAELERIDRLLKLNPNITYLKLTASGLEVRCEKDCNIQHINVTNSFNNTSGTVQIGSCNTDVRENNHDLNIGDGNRISRSAV